MRADGEFGAVPSYTACRERGLPFLSRLSRPELLDDTEVLRRLSRAIWTFATDDRSGPRRSATDLGVAIVPAGRETRRDDGTVYEPISARLVVSRYPRTGDADHGRVIDGWQYEMFVTDAAASSPCGSGR